MAKDEYWYDHSDDEQEQVQVTLMPNTNSYIIDISKEGDHETEKVSIYDFELYKYQMLDMIDKSHTKIATLKSNISSYLG